jgi:hypothetical protein
LALSKSPSEGEKRELEAKLELFRGKKSIQGDWLPKAVAVEKGG